MAWLPAMDFYFSLEVLNDDFLGDRLWGALHFGILTRSHIDATTRVTDTTYGSRVTRQFMPPSFWSAINAQLWILVLHQWPQMDEEREEQG